LCCVFLCSFCCLSLSLSFSIETSLITGRPNPTSRSSSMNPPDLLLVAPSIRVDPGSEGNSSWEECHSTKSGACAEKNSRASSGVARLLKVGKKTVIIIFEFL